MRAKAIIILVSITACWSCNQVKRTSEFLFNRYKISTPSMSPTLNVGDTYPVETTDSFHLNDLVVFHPIEKLRQDNPDLVFVHRLVGTPGDILRMDSGNLFLNKKKYPFHVNVKQSYIVETSMPLNKRAVEGMDYNLMGHELNNPLYLFYSTQDEVASLKKNTAVIKITRRYDEHTSYYVVPFEVKSSDTWGPLRVPKKGDRIVITEQNRPGFELLITEHEKKQMPAAGETFVFEKNYYFVLGDNRNNALDSRFFGFIPEDQMVGVMIVD